MTGESAHARTAKIARGLLPAPLTAPAHARLWLSSALYYHANHFEMITTGYVVLQTAGSPLDVGVVGFCRAIPMFALGLVAGAATDRFRRTGVLLAVQAVGLVAALLLAVLFTLGGARVWQIAPLTALLGCAWATDYPTRRALIAEIHPREGVVPALSLESLTMQGNKIVAALASGLLLALGGGTLAYGWLTLVYGCNLLALVRLHRFPDTPRGPRSVGGVRLTERVRGGWGVAVRTPLVLGVLLVTMVMNLLVFPYQQMLPVVARDVLGIGPQQLGLLAGADGIGALVTGVALMRQRGRFRPNILFLCGSFGGAVAVIALAASPLFALSYGIQIAVGLCTGAFGAMQSALVLGAVAPAMRTRAMGMLAMAIGIGPFGALLAGALSATFGPTWTLAGMAALALVLMAAITARTRALHAA